MQWVKAGAAGVIGSLVIFIVMLLGIQVTGMAPFNLPPSAAFLEAIGLPPQPLALLVHFGYGIAWASDRLTALPHDSLVGGPEGAWDLGTRDTGAYATFSEVVRYLEWLGSRVSDATGPRSLIEAAAAAIHAHETKLTGLMLHGAGNLAGLADMPGVTILGGVDNPAREGLVSFAVAGRPSAGVVAALEEEGIRVHIRKDDHYSGNILAPLGMTDCIRVSLCHYNTEEEVARFLDVMRDLVDPASGH